MRVNYTLSEPQAQDSRPPAGPHLLDVSMFWGASGGVRRVLTAKHERLRPLGWRHSIIAPDAHGSGLFDCGGVLLPHGGGTRLVLNRSRALRRMELLAPDLIESADPYTLAWASLAAAEQLRVPAVAFCHGNLAARLAGGSGGTARLACRYLVNLYRNFDLVMAPSHGLAQCLQAWGVPRVTLQPLGVDCSVFTPCAQDEAWRAQLCRDHGLDGATRLFIYTGRFAREKNLQLLADAVVLLGKGHALVAVGSGPSPPVGPQVLLLPPQDDSRQLARMVASCDAYVHAGDHETFGLGVLEAMACGTPVIAARAGGLAELALGAGLLVDRPRAGSWAEAMDASLSGNNAAQRRAALARAQAQDWPRVMLQMTQRYTALLGRPAAAAQAPPARGLALPSLAGSLARHR